MSIDVSFAFPLSQVTDTDMQKLGQELWNWQLCGACDGRSSCTDVQCPWSRSKRLGSFWKSYKEIASMYVPELFRNRPALESHGDLLGIIRLIKTDPDTTRSELTQRCFAASNDEEAKTSDTADQNRAFNMAVRVMLMVNCGFSHQSMELLEYAQLPRPWRNDTSIAQFISEAFPTSEHPHFDDQIEHSEHMAIRKAVSALSMKRRAKLRLVPTNDLRNHLQLDRKKGTVEIFHQTAFLKESLIAGHSLDSRLATVSDSVHRGNIPRALALETLDTIHKILFPPDQASQAFLSSLVSQAGFDEDCLRYESARYRKAEEKSSSYHYWGARLAELYDEVQNPTPRGWFHTWLERKSGARYVMMATLIGVMIAIVIGILGLVVATFQAWVAWQQWKHPVDSG